MVLNLIQITEFAVFALSPIERYSAMRQLETRPPSGVMTNKWFVVLGWSLIALLLILLAAVRRMRLEKERLAMEERFSNLADRCRLSQQEREILESISLRAGVKNKDLIFTEPQLFDNGLARMMQESFESGHNLVQRKRLNVMAYGIKTKLGFQKSMSEFGLTNRTGRNLSSRQISIGRTVLISQATQPGSPRFEAAVIRNDEYELAILPKTAIEAVPGQIVAVQYRVGSITWEFDSIVISCGPQGLELNHTDRIRFINRRRFQRVPVQKKAKVALFDVMFEAVGLTSIQPEFQDATITEISGPGLRIRAPLNVKMRDRILVVFELETGRWLQDIAEVRGFRDTPLGRSIGVEMIGLNEKAINELIRVTNGLAGTVMSQSNEDYEDGGIYDFTEQPEEQTI
ncbi:MAG: hypothetical protein ABFD91_00620 [Anaerohalosphaeraceae bacterium]